MEESEIQGINVEVEGYRVVRLDKNNVAIQAKKTKDAEILWINEGFYNTERAAFLRLFHKITRDKPKSEIAEVLKAIHIAEKSIVQALSKARY